MTACEEPARDQLCVPFAGPTPVNRWTLGAYMGDAMMRHPSFRLMPLPRIGSVRLMTSARHYADFVNRHVANSYRSSSLEFVPQADVLRMSRRAGPVGLYLGRSSKSG